MSAKVHPSCSENNLRTRVSLMERNLDTGAEVIEAPPPSSWEFGHSRLRPRGEMIQERNLSSGLKAQRIAWGGGTTRGGSDDGRGEKRCHRLCEMLLPLAEHLLALQKT